MLRESNVREEANYDKKTPIRTLLLMRKPNYQEKGGNPSNYRR